MVFTITNGLNNYSSSSAYNWMHSPVTEGSNIGNDMSILMWLIGTE